MFPLEGNYLFIYDLGKEECRYTVCGKITAKRKRIEGHNLILFDVLIEKKRGKMMRGCGLCV